MNISRPGSLKDFVDDQISTRGYGTCSEYVRELIRKDQDRQKLRALLLEGADRIDVWRVPHQERDVPKWMGEASG